MPVNIAYETKIEHISILDEHGNFDASMGEGLIPNDDLVAMYKHLMTCRHLDEIAFKLQRITGFNRLTAVIYIRIPACCKYNSVCCMR